jgi:small subunit ribosomal protein S6
MNPELGDDAVQSTIDRMKGVLEKKGAQVLREEAWGKRKLAFMVKKQPRGTFHLLHYVAGAGTVEELERTFRNTDQVLRYLTVGNGPVSDLEARRAEVEKVVREAEARRAKAEEERKEREAREALEGASDRSHDDYRSRDDRSRDDRSQDDGVQDAGDDSSDESMAEA